MNYAQMVERFSKQAFYGAGEKIISGRLRDANLTGMVGRNYIHNR